MRIACFCVTVVFLGDCPKKINQVCVPKPVVFQGAYTSKGPETGGFYPVPVPTGWRAVLLSLQSSSCLRRPSQGKVLCSPLPQPSKSCDFQYKVDDPLVANRFCSLMQEDQSTPSVSGLDPQDCHYWNPDVDDAMNAMFDTDEIP